MKNNQNIKSLTVERSYNLLEYQIYEKSIYRSMLSDLINRLEDYVEFDEVIDENNGRVHIIAKLNVLNPYSGD